MEQKDQVECVYDEHKQRTPYTQTFYQGPARLQSHKQSLDAQGVPNRLSPAFAFKYSNVLYSQDGSLYICKLCVEAKDKDDNYTGNVCAKIHYFVCFLTCQVLFACVCDFCTQVKDGTQKQLMV